MKKLFKLTYTTGGDFVQIPKSEGVLCFGSKVEAKARRDEINAANLGYKVKVSPGPDHWRAQK